MFITLVLKKFVPILNRGLEPKSFCSFRLRFWIFKIILKIPIFDLRVSKICETVD